VNFCNKIHVKIKKHN